MPYSQRERNCVRYILSRRTQNNCGMLQRFVESTMALVEMMHTVSFHLPSVRRTEVVPPCDPRQKEVHYCHLALAKRIPSHPLEPSFSHRNRSDSPPNRGESVADATMFVQIHEKKSVMTRLRNPTRFAEMQGSPLANHKTPVWHTDRVKMRMMKINHSRSC